MVVMLSNSKYLELKKYMQQNLLRLMISLIGNGWISILEL